MIGPEDQKISIDSFKGLYDRGSVDEVPRDHAQASQNNVFTSEGHFKTRPPLTRLRANDFSGGIRRFFMPESSLTKGLIKLNSNGQFYLDTLGSGASTLIDTVSGALDFAALNINNRTIYSPNNGFDGLPNQHIRVYDPLIAASRDIAGTAPEQASGSKLAAANSATAGSIAAGVHKIAVIYETNTGFWTPPGPKVTMTVSAVSNGGPCEVTMGSAHGFTTGESHQIYGGTGAWAAINDVWHVTVLTTTKFSIPLDSTVFGAISGTIKVAGTFTPPSFTADGTKSVDITNIPVGPSQTAKRLLLATRADETEFFFIPQSDGGVFADNSTTSVTLSFLDTDLVASADYLFDILEAVPVGTGLAKFKGRLVVADSYLDGNNLLGAERLLLSEVNDPETFKYTSGYIQVQNENDGNNVRAAFVLRDTLYACKFTGIFATVDNGSDPSTWDVTLVDGSVGGTNYCFSSIINSQTQSDTGDLFVFAHRIGLFLFNGVVQRPELSYKIQNLWLRINPAYFARVTVAHDIWNHRIYISAPLDSATDADTLFVCDYTDGRNPDDVKWDVWKFIADPTCIGMTYISLVNDYRFTLGSKNGNYLWALDPNSLNDDDNTVPIDNFYKLAPLMYGGVSNFKHLRARAWGSATLKLTVNGLDGQNSTTLPSLNLTNTGGKELDRQLNFVNEKMSLILEVNAENEYMVVDRIDVWGNTVIQSRPQ